VVSLTAGEQIWASPDYRVVWNIHNPSMGGDDGAPGIYVRPDRDRIGGNPEDHVEIE
jgi:hypothetical protein